METFSLFNNRLLGLDKRVWLVMMTVGICSIGLVSFIRSTSKPCVTFSISTQGLTPNKGGNFYTGELIRFTASIENNKNITWNFGDNSEEEKGTTIVSHIYNKDGKYLITANINGKCEEVTSVYVDKPLVIIFRKDSIDPQKVITSPVASEVNKAVAFLCNESATKYEWTILNRNEYPIQSGKIAGFTFKGEGSYIVQLKLDNDRQKVYTKTIHISPSSKPTVINPNQPTLSVKRFTPITLPVVQPVDSNNNKQPELQIVQPVKKEPEDIGVPKGKVQVSNLNLTKRFEGVLQGSKSIRDFDDVFLCDGAKVLINNSRDWKTLEDFCKMIWGQKDNIKIESIVQVNDENRCIINLKVTAKMRKHKLLRTVWVPLE